MNLVDVTAQRWQVIASHISVDFRQLSTQHNRGRDPNHFTKYQMIIPVLISIIRKSDFQVYPLKTPVLIKPHRELGYCYAQTDYYNNIVRDPLLIILY